MIQKRTVLILGAGASAEYGLPLGNTLFRMIHQFCANISERSTFSEIIEQMQISQKHALEFAASLKGSSSESIDDFLARRPIFREIGKAAIAMALLAHEQNGSLTQMEGRSRLWYPYLFSHLTGNDPTHLFSMNRLTIVTFNYDRSIEQAYRMTFEHNYGCNSDMIDHYMLSVPIIHLHGMLGTLQENPYGCAVTVDSLRRAMNGISIVDEVDDSRHRGPFARAIEHIRAADKIIILGFGFHPQNLERLNLRNTNANIFATCYGRADAENTAAEQFMKSPVTWARPDESIREFMKSSNCLLC
jgi:hypothetical protein